MAKRTSGKTVKPAIPRFARPSNTSDDLWRWIQVATELFEAYESDTDNGILTSHSFKRIGNDQSSLRTRNPTFNFKDNLENVLLNSKDISFGNLHIAEAGLHAVTGISFTANNGDTITPASEEDQVTALSAINGTEVHVDEGSGGSDPSFDLELTFSSVTNNPGAIILLGRYEDTSSSHKIDLYMKDDGANWRLQESDVLEDVTTNTNKVYVIDQTYDYVQGDDTVVIRFRHNGSGTTTHDMYLDFCNMIEYSIDMPINGTAYTITGLEEGIGNRMTTDIVNGKIIIEENGLYFISVSGSFVGTQEAIFEGTLYKDNIENQHVGFNRQMNVNGEVGSASSGLVPMFLPKDSELVFKFTSTLNNSILSFYHFNFTVLKVG